MANICCNGLSLQSVRSSCCRAFDVVAHRPHRAHCTPRGRSTYVCCTKLTVLGTSRLILSTMTFFPLSSTSSQRLCLTICMDAHDTYLALGVLSADLAFVRATMESSTLMVFAPSFAKASAHGLPTQSVIRMPLAMASRRLVWAGVHLTCGGARCWLLTSFMIALQIVACWPPAIASRELH